MKIKNIFKKETKKVAIAKVEAIEKDQLAKVIGGSGDDDNTAISPTTLSSSRHETAKNSVGNIR